MTGRVVYTAPVTVAGKYSHAIDVKSFSRAFIFYN